MRFFLRELEPLLATARHELAPFLGARGEDLAFVRNTTEGVGAVIGSLPLAPGDELLTTDHAYGACRLAFEHVAKKQGATLRVVKVPFPITRPEEVLDALLAGVTPRTRLALVDHVTSPTGLVFPIETIVPALRERGVETLVDGAHAPGMLPLALEALGAAYYVGNFHKWCCAPKGAAFLWARPDRQRGLHPPVISHGYASGRARSRFLEEFDWTGTSDPSAWLCVPEAIRFVGGLAAGGWDAIRAHCRTLTLAARDALCEALEIPAPAPDEMLGQLAAVPLPAGAGPHPETLLDPLQDALFERHRIEVPVPPWPAPPKRLLRVGAHVYNTPAEYTHLAQVLRAELAAERRATDR